MKRSEIDRTAIGPTTSIRLAVAAELAFPGGGIGISGLRSEARKGNLVTWRVAGKEFTTLQAIEDMNAAAIGRSREARPSPPQTKAALVQAASASLREKLKKPIMPAKR